MSWKLSQSVSSPSTKSAQQSISTTASREPDVRAFARRGTSRGQALGAESSMPERQWWQKGATRRDRSAQRALAVSSDEVGLSVRHREARARAASSRCAFAANREVRRQPTARCCGPFACREDHVLTPNRSKLPAAKYSDAPRSAWRSSVPKEGLPVIQICAGTPPGAEERASDAGKRKVVAETNLPVGAVALGETVDFSGTPA